MDQVTPASCKTVSASPLLALPAELRNAIWTFLLVHAPREHLSPPAFLFPGVHPEKTTQISTNILLTCRQANSEGTPILYGDNIFVANPTLLKSLPSLFMYRRVPHALLPPVKSLKAISLIKRLYIHVRLDTDPRFTAAQASDAFSGVEELEVEVFQSMYNSCDFSVLKLFEGVRGVKRAKVQGSVGDGRYAKWLETSMMTDGDEEVGRYEDWVLGRSLGWEMWKDGNR